MRWEMRDQLPYTVATLREVQRSVVVIIMIMMLMMIMTLTRFADIAPTGLMHKTVCDVALDGFELGQDTLVLANHSACHKVE